MVALIICLLLRGVRRRGLISNSCWLCITGGGILPRLGNGDCGIGGLDVVLEIVSLFDAKCPISPGSLATGTAGVSAAIAAELLDSFGDCGARSTCLAEEMDATVANGVCSLGRPTDRTGGDRTGAAMVWISADNGEMSSGIRESHLSCLSFPVITGITLSRETGVSTRACVISSGICGSGMG